MRTVAAATLGAAFGLLLSAGAGAEDETSAARRVLECMRRNAPETTIKQTVELITVDRGGSERSQSGRLYVKRGEDGLGRLLLRVERPVDLRGTAFLAVQTTGLTDMFLYLPEFRRVRRITSHSLRGKLLGTDFTYEELEYLLAFARSADLRRTGEGEVAGRTVDVLEATPDPVTGSLYTRIVSHVDRETCVPIQIDFYEATELPRKQLTCDPDKVAREGEAYVPRLVRMRDLPRGTESRLIVHSVEFDPGLPDRMFTQGELEKRH